MRISHLLPIWYLRRKQTSIESVQCPFSIDLLSYGSPLYVYYLASYYVSSYKAIQPYILSWQITDTNTAVIQRLSELGALNTATVALFYTYPIMNHIISTVVGITNLRHTKLDMMTSNLDVLKQKRRSFMYIRFTFLDFYQYLYIIYMPCLRQHYFYF